MSINHLLTNGSGIPQDITVNKCEATEVKSDRIIMDSATGTVRFAIQIPPLTTIGDVGDTAGDVILGNDGYLYVCFGNYDAITPIWQRVQLAGW